MAQATAPLLDSTSGDELSPYSTGAWIELGLWRRNLFATVIVGFRVFVGSPVEVLDFNLEFPRGPRGFERSVGLGAARPSNRTGRFILVSALPTRLQMVRYSPGSGHWASVYLL